jgi:hypothetical protein
MLPFLVRPARVVTLGSCEVADENERVDIHADGQIIPTCAVSCVQTLRKIARPRYAQFFNSTHSTWNTNSRSRSLFGLP